MKKAISIALLISFVLCFSGKPASDTNAAPKCGPQITVKNLSGYTVTQMVIKNNTQFTTTTINNPSFPYTWNDLGYDMELTFTFSNYVTGSVWLVDPSDCRSFMNTNTAVFPFQAFCNPYEVRITNNISSCPF